jgi:hypothetical protein
MSCVYFFGSNLAHNLRLFLGGSSNTEVRSDEVVGDDEVRDAWVLDELERHAREGGCDSTTFGMMYTIAHGGRDEEAMEMPRRRWPEAVVERPRRRLGVISPMRRHGSVRVVLDAVKLDSLPEWVGNGGCSSCNCPSVHVDAVCAVVQLGAVAWGCSNREPNCRGYRVVTLVWGQLCEPPVFHRFDTGMAVYDWHITSSWKVKGESLLTFPCTR